MLVRLPGCQARVRTPCLAAPAPPRRSGQVLRPGLALTAGLVCARAARLARLPRPAMVEAEVSLRSLVSQCVELAQRAGTLIRGISDKASTEEGREALRLHDKGSATGNFDPQTVADRQAQRCIVENLRALYGTSLRVVGEEGNLGLEDSADGDPIEIREPSAALLHDVWLDSGDVVLPLSELCIWVDPLDGTKEFTEGRYEFVSTLIGISQLGQPVAGVIAEPYNLDPQARPRADPLAALRAEPR